MVFWMPRRTSCVRLKSTREPVRAAIREPDRMNDNYSQKLEK